MFRQASIAPGLRCSSPWSWLPLGEQAFQLLPGRFGAASDDETATVSITVAINAAIPRPVMVDLLYYILLRDLSTDSFCTFTSKCFRDWLSFPSHPVSIPQCFSITASQAVGLNCPGAEPERALDWGKRRLHWRQPSVCLASHWHCPPSSGQH
jgi:hypothetical protein